MVRHGARVLRCGAARCVSLPCTVLYRTVQYHAVQLCCPLHGKAANAEKAGPFRGNGKGGRSDATALRAASNGTVELDVEWDYCQPCPPLRFKGKLQIPTNQMKKLKSLPG